LETSEVALAVKKKVYGLTLAFALLFSAAAGLMLAQTATANPVPYPNQPREHHPVITINRDGSITPQTDLISQNATTYALTANITDYTIITIECSDIVFDGEGHTTNNAIWVGYGPPGASNVTIKNVELISYSQIVLLSCSHCQVTNVTSNVKSNYQIYVGMSDHTNISQCTGNIKLWWGAENTQVFRNNITFLVVAGGSNWSNIFYRNNFLHNNYGPSLYDDCFWDNGSVGNYWVGYNGTDADGDGIGDTPYVIDEDNVDYHPLMYPYDIENDAIAFPARTPFPLFFVAAVSAVSVAGVAVGLFYRHNKRWKAKVSSKLVEDVGNRIMERRNWQAFPCSYSTGRLLIRDFLK
jgi:hypothetical protein